MTNSSRLLAVAVVAVAWDAATAGAQQPAAAGTITGRVTEQGSGAPLAAAQVFVVGSTRGAITAENGSYRIPGVPSGSVEVRVRRLGFAAQTRTVTVTPNGTATADFTVARAAATQLEQVVVTATGEQQRVREQGNAVGVIPTLEPERLAAVQNFSQALAGQAPGVQVLQSAGTTGAGARIRIRGANSISLSNEPLIIIDGVRVNSNASSTAFGVGGQTPSRLNDINPEDIERVEVLKGPAAAGLFGTQAANGVIQIFTKRGAVGRAQWNTFAERGRIDEVGEYPDNWGAWRTANGRPAFGCNLISVNSGACRQDSLATFNPLENRRRHPSARARARSWGRASRAGPSARRTTSPATTTSRRGSTARTSRGARTPARTCGRSSPRRSTPR
jgi:TonB-dependent SusC/RagA subfamily outer membrane receptor